MRGACVPRRLGRGAARGQAALELLLAAVTLLTLVVAAVDLAAVVSSRAALSQAVREGARLAAADLSASDAAVAERVRSAAQTAGLDPARLSPPSVTYGSRQPDQPITVSATYTVTLDPLLGSFVPGSVSASATLRQE